MVQRTLPTVAWIVLGVAQLGAAGPDDVLVRVNGEAITRGERDAVVLGAGPERGPVVEAAAVEQLLDQRLLLEELARQGIAPSDEEIDASLDDLWTRNADDPGFAAWWAAMNRDPVRLRRQVELELAITKHVQPKVTKAALEEHFAQHHREFDGTRLRISHILLRPLSGNIDAEEPELRRRAEEIRLAIVQGSATFADAAKLHSDAPSRRQGGDLGWIGRHEPCAEDFSSQVFPLAKGNVSQPFLTANGIHVATVTDVEPGPLGMGDVGPALQAHFAATTLRDLLTALRADATIEWAAGVPHFDPTDPPGATRRHVVTTTARQIP